MKHLLALATASVLALGSTAAMAASHHRAPRAPTADQQTEQNWAPGYSAVGPRGAYDAYGYAGGYTVPGSEYLPDSQVLSNDGNYGNPDRW